MVTTTDDGRDQTIDAIETRTYAVDEMVLLSDTNADGVVDHSARETNDADGRLLLRESRHGPR